MRELTRKRADKPLPRLQRAADKRNAAWLEEMDAEIYAAIDAELADGASVDDVVRVMAETSTPGFVKVVRSAARWLEGMKGGG